MIFLFTEIDHPGLFRESGGEEAEHIRSSQLFLIEAVLHSHKVEWMKRTPRGVLSIFEGGEAATAAIALQKTFQEKDWERFGKAKLRQALHAGEAEKYGQNYLGPDMDHTRQLLVALTGVRIVLTPAAVHFTPLPPGAKLTDLGVHRLKDLSPPEALYALQHPDILTEDFPPLLSFDTYPQNLPVQASPFFGREEELSEITGLLSGAQARLVTLIGPGGFGKTRLALQSAAEMVDRFRDGVFLVSLAPLLSDQMILGSLAEALQFHFFGPDDPQVQILNHLREKEMLLVLDNFEHIIEGGRLVEELLAAAPDLKIMITTREGLKIKEERLFEVKGLRYPESGRLEEMEASGAVQLFLKSCRRIRADLSLPQADRESLLRICRLLEGMPLGLEISATWVGNMSLSEIADKIESSRDFLATTMPHLPPRHRSLRAVFEYSWILLSEAQKRALAALSVFKGGFNEAAARAVAGAVPQMLVYLENKSLLRRLAPGRFEIHELLKFYAKEKLFEDPREKERVLDAHCAYYAGLVHKRELQFNSPAQRRLLEELVEEMGNIREGWKRAVEKGMEKAVDLYLDGLFDIFDTKGWFEEAQDAFRTAARALREKYPEEPRPSKVGLLLARLMARQAAFEIDLGRARQGERLLKESLELFRAAKAEKFSGFAWSSLGTALENRGDYRSALGHFEQSLKVYRKLQDKPGIAWALNNLGHICSKLGDPERAKAYIAQSLAHSKASGDHRALAYSNILLGDALRDLGRIPEAKAHYQKGMRSYLESGDRRGLAWSFASLGSLASLEGDFPGARQMYRESMAISKDLGDLRALAWSKNLLGVVGWALGEYPEALQSYEEGLELYRGIEDRRGEAWTWDLIGNLRLAMMNDREAEKCYLMAYSLALKDGVDTAGVAWYYFHLGTLSHFRKEFKEAQARFSKALQCFEKTGDPAGQLATLIHLGEAACVLGDLSRSVRCFQRAVKLGLASSAKPLLVDLVAGLAGLLRAQGDERQAIAFLMVAVHHPTCRQQTKDRVTPFALELKSKFSEEEVGEILHWCSKLTLTGALSAWLGSSKGNGRREKDGKGRRGKRKKPARSKKVKKAKVRKVK